MHALMTRLARTMATIGGVVLSALIVLTCVSVAGRSLNTLLHIDWIETRFAETAQYFLDLGVGPILGDYELVEAGIAFAIFAFLPLCQITGGHASVDIFTSKFPDRINRFISMVVEVVFAIALVVIAWRLYEGMLSKMKYNETTYLLLIPVWWAYGASLFAAVIAALIGIYMALVRIMESLTGRIIITALPETDH